MDLIVLHEKRRGLWQFEGFGRRLAWGRVKDERVVEGIRRQLHAQVKQGFMPPRPWPSLKGDLVREVKVGISDRLFADLINQTL